MEPLFTVNNSYLGLFRKDDYNNDKIKIGKSFSEVEVGQIDPTKTRPPNKLPLPFEINPHGGVPWDQKLKKDHHFTREQFLTQPLGKDVNKFPMRA